MRTSALYAVAAVLVFDDLVEWFEHGFRGDDTSTVPSPVHGRINVETNFPDLGVHQWKY